MSIPKVIHYCWFGRGKKTPLMERCIESWREHCPDWEIVEWNEENFDVNFCPYASKAYCEKRYGFLTDAARLQIIYTHGGVYLDTDVELKRSLEPLLDFDAWFCYSDARHINTGSGFGAVAQNWAVGALLDAYLNLTSISPYTLCTELDTKLFMNVFPDFMHHTTDKVYNGVCLVHNIWKYSEHHYTGTWWTPAQYVYTDVRNIVRWIMRRGKGR